jgi:TolA-binding protein
MLGAQPARAFRGRGRPVTRRLARAAALAVVVLIAGCATRNDLMEQDRRLRIMMREQGRSIEQVKREVERLRADVEEGGHRTRGAEPETTPEHERIGDLERKVEQLETGSNQIGMTLSPEGMSTEEPAADTGTPPETPPAGATPPTTAPQQTAALAPAPPPPPPPPPPAAVDEEWKREVAQDQAVAGTMAVPERADYLGALEGLSHGDCSQAVPKLSSISTASKGSPLADNALYWQARCAAIRGDQKGAVSKFYDVVQRYPKSDKAPAALWQQGKLFLRMGDAPDARLSMAKLIKDYPSSTEAGLARQKLAELDQ